MKIVRFGIPKQFCLKGSCKDPLGFVVDNCILHCKPDNCARLHSGAPQKTEGAKKKVGGEPTVDLFCSLISCPVRCKGGLMLLDSSGRPSLWHLSALPGQALAGCGPGSVPCSRDPKTKYTPRQTGNANQPSWERQVGVLTTRALAEAHTYPQCLPKPSAGTSKMQPHVNYHS